MPHSSPPDSTHHKSPCTSVQALTPHSPMTPSGLALGACRVTIPVIIDSSFFPLPTRRLLSQVFRWKGHLPLSLWEKAFAINVTSRPRVCRALGPWWWPSCRWWAGPGERKGLEAGLLGWVWLPRNHSGAHRASREGDEIQESGLQMLTQTAGMATGRGLPSGELGHGAALPCLHTEILTLTSWSPAQRRAPWCTSTRAHTSSLPGCPTHTACPLSFTSVALSVVLHFLTLILCARHPWGSPFLWWILPHTPTPHTAAHTASRAMYLHPCTHTLVHTHP